MASVKALVNIAILSAGVASSPLAASPIVFAGQDNVATTTSAHPNSSAQAAAFDLAVAGIGGGSLATFENVSVGSFATLAAAPGLTITGADYSSSNQMIRDSSNFPAAPTLDGYNTTAAGTKFLEVQGGTLTFSFSNPVYAFGAYFSGVQTNFFGDFFTFSDGTTQSISIPGTGTTNSIGALSFVGFVDAGKAISSLTLTAGSAITGADFIGVDDVRFAVPASAVPESATWTMLLAGFGMIGFAARKRSSVKTNVSFA